MSGNGDVAWKRSHLFMVGEDIVAGETLTAKSDFNASSSTAGKPKDLLLDLIVPTREPIGVRLLRTMGWREGKGVGAGAQRPLKKPPRIRPVAAPPTGKVIAVYQFDSSRCCVFARVCMRVVLLAFEPLVSPHRPLSFSFHFLRCTVPSCLLI